VTRSFIKKGTAHILLVQNKPVPGRCKLVKLGSFTGF